MKLFASYDREDDGSFSFHCSQAASLCNCIQHVGWSGEEPHFVAGNIGLNVFRHEGLVGYEITEDGYAVVYGDVNEGRSDRRCDLSTSVFTRTFPFVIQHSLV